jgi:hypothetical protein
MQSFFGGKLKIESVSPRASPRCLAFLLTPFISQCIAINVEILSLLSHFGEHTSTISYEYDDLHVHYNHATTWLIKI